MSKVERNILGMADPNRVYRIRRALRAEDERAALKRVLAAAILPEGSGTEIPVAPCRGSLLSVPQVTMVPKGASEWEPRAGGFAGCDPVRARDVFDARLEAAARARSALPLTPGQVGMGRRYRDLVERHDAGGIKCSVLDRSGGSGREFMDAFLAEGRELAAIRRRIGAGSALAVRRIRPSVRGSRRSITDRALVDMVCLEGASLSDVLRRHGWTRQTPVLKALLGALGGALDRMTGYRGA